MLLALLLRNQGHPDLKKWQRRCESLLDQRHNRRVVIDLIENLCWAYQCLGQNLNTTLHRLRKLLGDDEAVVQQGGQLFINGDLCWVDCWQFQQQVRQLESSLAHRTGVNQYLTEALTLYRGPFAAGHQHLSITVGYSSELHTQWLNVLASAVPFFVAKEMDTTSRRPFSRLWRPTKLPRRCFRSSSGH